MSTEQDPAAEWKAQLDELRNRFTYHPPTDAQALVYPEIRSAALDTAQMLWAMCQPSRELSLAMTHLEEMVFWANASIARHGLKASVGT